MTRRTFSAAMLAASAAVAQEKKPIRLGAPIFLKSDDPAELAREHKRLHYTAAYCPQAKSDDSARVGAIRKAFAEESIIIAEVGAWANMLATDPAARKKALDYVTERLQLAEAVGARCAVDTAGSFAHGGTYDARDVSQEYFDLTVENCRKVIDAVKPKRTRFTIEAMFASLPDSADTYVDLILAVDRKEFGVHLDVCNLMNTPRKLYNSGLYIDELFRKLGPHIVSCHAKDLQIHPNRSLEFVEVVPGRGLIDYKAYLRNLAQVPLAAPLMLEHFRNDDEFQEGARYIRQQGAEAGVTFA